MSNGKDFYEKAVKLLSEVSENLGDKTGSSFGISEATWGKMTKGLDGVSGKLGELKSGLSESEGYLKKLGLPTESLTKVMGGLDKALGAVKVATDAIKVAQNAATLIQNAATIAQNLYNAAVNANPMMLFATIMITVIAVVIDLWKTNEGFRNAVISAWDAIKKSAGDCWNAIVEFFTKTIPDAFNSMLEFIMGIPEWFSEMWSNVLNVLKEWGVNIYNFFTETIPMWIESIVTWFTELPYKIGFAIGEFLGTLAAWGVSVWNYLAENIPIWIGNVVNFFAELPGKIGSAIGEFLGTLAKWGVSVWNYLAENIPIWIGNIVNWFAELPGKIWTFLLDIVNKVIGWGSQVYTNAITWVSNMVTSVIQFFSQLPGKIWEWLINTINKVVEFGSNLITKGRESAKNTIDSIIEGFTSLPGKMANIGKSVVEGIWNGIKNMGSWILKQIGGFASGLIDGFKKGFGINSPSKRMIPLGKGLIEGLEVGQEKETPNLQREINKNVEDTVKSMQATVNHETGKLTSSIVANVDTTSDKDAQDNFIGKFMDVLASTKNTIEVMLDGEVVAKATAPFMNEELAFYANRGIR